MKLSQLEAFLAIIDTGSFSEAADHLGLSQSAISRALIKLETELDTKLVERHWDGAKPTDIGTEIALHARSTLKQIEIIQQKTAKRKGITKGKLNLGIALGITPRVFTSLIREFQIKYPEIELVFFEGNPFEVQEWLGTDLVDVGMVPTVQPYPRWIQIAKANVKVIVAEAHPLTAYQAVRLEQLGDYNLIAPQSHYRYFKSLLEQRGLSIPRLRYAVSAYPTILTMVREQMGITILPEMLLNNISIEGITTLPLDPPLKQEIYLACHTDSPVALAFINHMQSQVNSPTSFSANKS